MGFIEGRRARSGAGPPRSIRRIDQVRVGAGVRASEECRKTLRDPVIGHDVEVDDRGTHERPVHGLTGQALCDPSAAKLGVDSEIEEETGRRRRAVQCDILEGDAERADHLFTQPSYEDPPLTVVPGPSIESRAPKGESIGLALHAYAVELESRGIVTGLVVGNHQLALTARRSRP